jgi:hypothetical protein
LPKWIRFQTGNRKIAQDYATKKRIFVFSLGVGTFLIQGDKRISLQINSFIKNVLGQNIQLFFI